MYCSVLIKLLHFKQINHYRKEEDETLEEPEESNGDKTEHISEQEAELEANTNETFIEPDKNEDEKEAITEEALQGKVKLIISD